MFDARRTYAYLVSAVSLAALFGALTWLLRGLLVPALYTTTLDTALQLAIIIIGVPVYLGHWLWQQRLAAKSAEERSALGRRIYLYAALAASIVVTAVNGYALAAIVTGVKPAYYGDTALDLTSPLYDLIPIVLAVALWIYHYLVLRNEQVEFPERGQLGTVRRLYIYGTSAYAAIQVSFTIVELSRWLISTVGRQLWNGAPLSVSLPESIATLVIYLPLWLIFWRWANQLFAASNEERESVLRKFYLYIVIFIGTVGTVSTLALLLAGIFRQLLDLSPQGRLEDLLAVLIGFALIWLYHALVLHEDLRTGADTVQQAEMRRLYLYLLAGVGLAALMAGAISELWLILDGSLRSMDMAHKDQLAYSTAAILAGLPLWFLAWRQVQIEAAGEDVNGDQARRSGMRKFYIYFFQFISIMAVLGSAIFVVSQFVNWLLTQQAIDNNELTWPLAVSVVNLLAWLYHWRVLRTDRTLNVTHEVRRLEEMGIVLIQNADDQAIPTIYARLRSIAPELRLTLLKLEKHEREDGADGALEPDQGDSSLSQSSQRESNVPAMLQQLAGAQTIVASSTLLALGQAAHPLEWAVAQAMIASPARKLLLPVTSPEWLWIGAETLQEDKIAQEAVEALRQLARGETVRATRKLGCGVIALIVLGLLLLPSLYWMVSGLLFPY